MCLDRGVEIAERDRRADVDASMMVVSRRLRRLARRAVAPRLIVNFSTPRNFWPSRQLYATVYTNFSMAPGRARSLHEQLADLEDPVPKGIIFSRCSGVCLI